MEICVPDAKVLVSLHICTGSLESSVTVSESHVQARLAVCVPFMRAAKNIHKAAPEPFVTQQSDKYQTLLLARNVLSLSYMTSANALACLHICTGLPEPSLLYQNFMRWFK